MPDQNQTQSKPEDVFFGLVDGYALDDLPAETRLTPEQTARVLGVAKSTLQIWRATGRHNLPYVKIGARVNYRVGDLREWLTRRTQIHTGGGAA